MTTIAGSGTSGIADGTVTTAQFIFPAGVALDRHGNIFVADAGAQRIKEVTTNGTVRTIAGTGEMSFGHLWVEGGYADGPASSAHFGVPMGIAVDDSGTIYVADSANHVIRRIKDGVVSTFAGNRDDPGDVSGALKDSRFRLPVALALDREGDLYVADMKNGIREITPDGNVVALDLKVDRPTGISIYEDGSDKWISIADYGGILRVFPHRDPVRVPVHPIPNVIDGPEGGSPIGYPCGISMFGPHAMLFTDSRTHTIRIYADLQTRVVAGRSYDDVENDGGGYRDGTGSAATFYSPLGIVRASDGSFIVADAGNRRLRRISPFDTRSAVNPQLDEAPTLSESTYNVVIVGNSFAWFDTDFHLSIAGDLERALENVRPHGKPIRVTIVSSPAMGLPAEESLFSEYLYNADFSIFLLNSLVFPSSFPDLIKTQNPNAELVAQTSQSLQRMEASLTHKHQAMALIHPWPWEFSGSEATYSRLYEKIDQEWLIPVPSFHQMLIDSVRQADLPYVDFWDVLTAREAAADRVPYFGSNAAHFSRAGRQLLADTLARWLIAKHPWADGP